MKSLFIFGTRPEAIKLAPLIKTLEKKFDVFVVNSGQHTKLVKQVIDFFDIKVDFDLTKKVNVENRTLPQLISLLTLNIDDVIKKLSPDFVIVQGDTATAYVGGLISFLNKIPVIHIEAGLRSNLKYSPFPEEMNRRLLGYIADLHFVPTYLDAENLKRENVREDRIFLVGNTIVDAVHLGLGKIDTNNVYRELSRNGVNINLSFNKFVFITTHRRENIGEPLKNICQAIDVLTEKHPDMIFIWSLHLNPEVRKIIKNELSSHNKNLFFIEPVSYETTLFLIKSSYLVMTDSGGLQEECATLGKPVIILREVTERSIILEKGAGILGGTQKDNIIKSFEELFHNEALYLEMSSKGKNIFGDGETSKQIKKVLSSDIFKEFVYGYPATELMDFSEIKVCLQ